MTTEVTQVNEDNVFQAPQAELTNNSTDKPILEFPRFSAWWVALLAIFTFGIYTFFWLYNRSVKANAYSKQRKAVLPAVYAVIGSTLVMWFGPFLIANEETMSIVTILTYLVYIPAWLVAIFSLRGAVRDVINQSSDHEVHLGGVMTFFFSSIYIQYKINEAIDTQS
ncbi:DUF4234 domain-containing protein [Thalassotalea litorea]|uniref:DUF4234 domain-containing protein n=1 Tax=Thalassotalea litorea TaxID=2020715 RepID=A0A5R9INV4_9GAMM|nr:DUF4234 domain-containing protein [Thalassotalea litorea]TLU67224.1 DUF4234 domain-containing protein [Thalassotalea litorea]